MNNDRQYHHGYTIMEIIVVLIIISFVAAFAIPNFTKTIQKKQREIALQNVKAIVAKAMILAEREREYTTFCFSGTNNLAEINTNCNLTIVDNTISYCGSDNDLQLIISQEINATQFMRCIYTGPGPVTLTNPAACTTVALDPC